ncbi:MAG: hypothetical protein WCO35_03365 [Candidatus Nomurabacteria bacterium]
MSKSLHLNKIETIKFLLSFYDDFVRLDDVSVFNELIDCLLSNRSKKEGDLIWIIEHSKVLISVKQKALISLLQYTESVEGNRIETGKVFIEKLLEKLKKNDPENIDTQLIDACENVLGLRSI